MVTESNVCVCWEVYVGLEKTSSSESKYLAWTALQNNVCVTLYILCMEYLFRAEF